MFELANKTENLALIMGNHDYWFAFGIPSPRPKLMSEEELEHQKWNHEKIGKEYRKIAQKWKFVEKLKIDNKKEISFLHYGYDEKKNWFKEYVKDPNVKSLDKLFEGIKSEIIFYGHNHEPSDIIGNCIYVNLGSTGCNNKPEVRVGILNIKEENIELVKIFESYDDDGLMEDFEHRKVPAREFIVRHFITRK